MHAGTLQVEPLEEAVPTDYHGIAFDDWLDIFLQYALLVTDQDDQEEAYDTLSAAAGACVWYHSKRMMRLIHVCWFSQFSLLLLLVHTANVLNSMRTSSPG